MSGIVLAISAIMVMASVYIAAPDYEDLPESKRKPQARRIGFAMIISLISLFATYSTARWL